ncbi:MAG TPA: translation initiation factor IF-2 [Candidatus Heimdallarchaeota archaeon]|nr:translation initiation factor IF-2 [Candidatus Heimdallarchaeota archaeon]
MNTETKKKTAKTSKETATKNPKEVQIIEGMNIKEVSEIIGIKAKDLINNLNKKRFNVGVNDTLNASLIDAVSQITEVDIDLISLEEYIQKKAKSIPENLVERPPVVTIMGHVDHGKTTLLDAFRESNLVQKEAGGITQHIGAYQLLHNDRKITFVDTPGHEAFTQLRARGTKVTDIVILVVAADDGVMPQTKEAINHAKAAGVPIIVAINKIDKPEADLDRTKKELSKEGLLIEEWGGDVVSVDISATEKTNLNELLEMILLLNDVMEIKGNPMVPAQGVILEARLDSQKGPVATVIIQQGTLNQGEAFVSGICYGKARALFNEKGKSIKKAELSMPVEVLGFSEVPNAGGYFQVVKDLEAAKRIARYRLSLVKKEELTRPEHLTLDQLFKKIEEGDVKELPLIIKADVHGSVEVLKDTLPNLSTDKVKIKIYHAATGTISESDIMLASASNAIIIGYNVKPQQALLDMAREEKVEIRSYNVIYQLTDDIKKAMTGLLDPISKETSLGRAEVRRIFHIPRIGSIAGCLVTEGKISRNAEVRIIRNDEVIHKGKISSLKHLKNNVTEVKKDYECGIGVEKFKDIQEGDAIEAFIIEKVMPE